MKKNEEIEEKYMFLALEEAKKAYLLKEIPVGAVIVHENKVISSGYNMRESKNNALAHAEIIAINNACIKLNSWRLIDCDLYVTLEPCPMCAGAIINSRLSRVIYAASDPKSGVFGSLFDIFQFQFNHHPQIISGILKNQSSDLIKSFFKNLRLHNL